ncbi:hypothetical protein Droror1_Dr00013707 [Drosera rotundifolia]
MAAAEARHTSYKSNHNKSSINKKKGKNPYADLGREGFSALLEELKEKKQKILSLVGPEDVSLIRFVHSDDNKLKPVVVVASGNKERKMKLLSNDDRPGAVAADDTEASKHASALIAQKEEDHPATAALGAEQDMRLATASAEDPSDEQDNQLGATRSTPAQGSANYPSVVPPPSPPPRTPQMLNMSNKTSKNPYSNLGLEKFSALLQELEEKKKEIISQMGPDEVPLIRFAHSGENRLKPIVVAAKGMKDRQLVATGSASAMENVKQPPAAPVSPSTAAVTPQVVKTRSKNGKNPYADLGLEKFSALLEEIEEKKRQIMSQINPEEAPVIRFSYSGDNDLKPIVVSAKGKKDRQLVAAWSAPTEENSSQPPSVIPTSSATASPTTSAAASPKPAAASRTSSAAASPTPSTAASPARSTAALPRPVLRTNKKNGKNPYAGLGREKFSALLKELEEKKQEIISQISPEEVPLVRFSSSGDNLKPIVVIAKGKKDRQLMVAKSASTPSSSSKAPPTTSPTAAQAALQVLRTSNQNSKTPYSNLGLDKFSALLEELEEKKQQIFSQINQEDVSLLRFSYSGNNELKAIVVTAKGKKDVKGKIYSCNGGRVAVAESQKQAETTESEADEEAISHPAAGKEDDMEENLAAVAAEESNQTLTTAATKGFEDIEECNVDRER